MYNTRLYCGSNFRGLVAKGPVRWFKISCCVAFVLSKFVVLNGNVRNGVLHKHKTPMLTIGNRLSTVTLYNDIYTRYSLVHNCIDCRS